MHKYAIAVRDQTQEPVLVFVYVLFDLGTGRYVGLASTATGKNGTSLADSVDAIINDICSAIRIQGNQIVQGPILVARSRVKVIRWGGNTFMVSFRDGVLISDVLLDRMASASSPAELPRLLVAEHDVPPGNVHTAFSRDETLVWDGEVLKNVLAARNARDREHEDDRLRERRNDPVGFGEEWTVEDHEFWVPEPGCPIEVGLQLQFARPYQLHCRTDTFASRSDSDSNLPCQHMTVSNSPQETDNHHCHEHPGQDESTCPGLS